ncbi:MAG: hypothetical protein ABIQ53_09380 [Terracoccus sp.]
MAVEVAADDNRFVGRYSVPLAVSFADWAAVGDCCRRRPFDLIATAWAVRATS